MRTPGLVLVPLIFVPHLLLGCEGSAERVQNPCSLPICASCPCDETTACDDGCAACDPECGQCRPHDLICPGGSGPPDQPAPGTADAGTNDRPPLPPAGSLGLESHGGRTSDRVGFSSAGEGRVFAIVDLTLSNRTGQPVPLSPPLFSIQTARGLTYLGHALTTQLATGCPTDALLETENSAHCSMVFEIGDTDEAASVRYTPQGGAPVTTPLSLTSCTRCGDACIDPMIDLDHCGTCDRPVPSNASCIGGRLQCDDVRLTPCPTEIWRALDVTGPGWINFPLDHTCVDTSAEPLECGGCGRRYECWSGPTVVSVAACRSGRPTCESGELRSVLYGTIERRTCRSLCSDVGGEPMRSPDLEAVFWFYRTPEDCIDWVEGLADQTPPVMGEGFRCGSAGSFLGAACRCALP